MSDIAFIYLEGNGLLKWERKLDLAKRRILDDDRLTVMKREMEAVCRSYEMNCIDRELLDKLILSIKKYKEFKGPEEYSDLCSLLELYYRGSKPNFKIIVITT